MPANPIPRSATIALGHVEADAVVLDNEPHLAVACFEHDVDAAGVRVLGTLLSASCAMR